MAACKAAGIMVRMVTGDNVETAVAIAKECDIMTDGGVAMVCLYVLTNHVIDQLVLSCMFGREGKLRKHRLSLLCRWLSKRWAPSSAR